MGCHTSSSSFIVIRPLWPTLEPKVGQIRLSYSWGHLLRHTLILPLVANGHGKLSRARQTKVLIEILRFQFYNDGITAAPSTIWCHLPLLMWITCIYYLLEDSKHKLVKLIVIVYRNRELLTMYHMRDTFWIHIDPMELLSYAFLSECVSI